MQWDLAQAKGAHYKRASLFLDCPAVFGHGADHNKPTGYGSRTQTKARNGLTTRAIPGDHLKAQPDAGHKPL